MPKSFIVGVDMGSVKVFSDDLSCFFDNGAGDMSTRVVVYTTKKEYPDSEAEFLDHFTVKQAGTVHLSNYDCDDAACYTFGIGRWWVYLLKNPRLKYPTLVITRFERDGLDC